MSINRDEIKRLIDFIPEQDALEVLDPIVRLPLLQVGVVPPYSASVGVDSPTEVSMFNFS